MYTTYPLHPNILYGILHSMIGRLHFEHGLPLDLSKDVDLQVVDALVAHETEIQYLPLRRDRYRLTPEWWTKHILEHSIEVHPDGTGTYYAIPREDDPHPETAGTIELSQHGSIRRNGGRIVDLPQDEWKVVLAGPLEDRKTIGIHEIVIFVPGPSPQLA